VEVKLREDNRFWSKPQGEKSSKFAANFRREAMYCDVTMRRVRATIVAADKQ
jgi:hypothetical protein